VIILRQSVVQVLLEHGVFTSRDTQAVGLSLAIYTLAVITDALCQPLWRLVYAWRDGRLVLAVNGAQTLIRLAANLILVGVIGYNGLAVSAVIGLSIQLLILMALARRRLGWQISRAGWSRAIRITLAASLAALATFGVLQGLAKFLAQPSPWLILLVGGFALLLLYGAFLAGFLRRPLQDEEGFFHW
jgi:putative peptidoglycan lipid II flippase